MYVPDDITRDILLRLTVKSLIRLTCVCKSWGYLILSDQFIDSHTKLGHRMEIIVSSQVTLKKDDRKFTSSDHRFLKSYFQRMSLCKIVQLPKNYEVIGHCNGIICLTWNRTMPSAIILWNPALRQCRALPPTDLPVDGAGFGYDTCNQDYKVVITSGMFSKVMMYSLKNSSWKSINCSHLRLRENIISYIHVGFFFQGRLYWILHGGHPISYYRLLVFDLAKEEFFEFDMSDTFNERDHIVANTIGIFRGRISLFLTSRLDYASERSFEIWSMEDHCIPQLWTRVVHSSSKVFDTKNASGITKDGQVFGTIHENGEVHLFLYNVETQREYVHRRKRSRSKDYSWHAISDFIETFVAVIPKEVIEKSLGGRWAVKGRSAPRRPYKRLKRTLIRQ